MKRCMTTHDLAKLLRCSERTARRYLAQGQIKGTRIGKRWLVREADLDAAFAQALAEKGETNA